ncbi:hypothetical protein JG688_00012834 [Phytophthora aleatoria]|uniref:Uncharacterized protein n=1 Tax=Phytophthora aleatoria TaxID=2496075 RepID=A0A8J5MEL4_9STRA|nr:hypothetical protein JG688_00012834 [Phytophthora aleatoria]
MLGRLRPGRRTLRSRRASLNTRLRLLQTVSVHVTRRTMSLTHRHRPRNILLADYRASGRFECSPLPSRFHCFFREGSFSRILGPQVNIVRSFQV